MPYGTFAGTELYTDTALRQAQRPRCVRQRTLVEAREQTPEPKRSISGGRDRLTTARGATLTRSRHPHAGPPTSREHDRAREAGVTWLDVSFWGVSVRVIACNESARGCGAGVRSGLS